jgi:anti-sigma B factor antagonist
MSQPPSTRDLTVAVEHRTHLVVVRCGGRLVAGTADRLYNQVKPLLPGPKRIVLDCKQLSHMDSSGMGTLVRLYVHCKSAGCTLELMNVGQSVKQLLGITHLLSVFQMIGENNIRIG